MQDNHDIRLASAQLTELIKQTDTTPDSVELYRQMYETLYEAIPFLNNKSRSGIFGGTITGTLGESHIVQLQQGLIYTTLGFFPLENTALSGNSYSFARRNLYQPGLLEVSILPVYPHDAEARIVNLENE